jgi:hypothetical protein
MKLFNNWKWRKKKEEEPKKKRKSEFDTGRDYNQIYNKVNAYAIFS